MIRLAGKLLKQAETRPREHRARDAALVVVGLLAGLRVGEMRLLDWGDIWQGMRSHRVRVRRGKGGKARTVFVPQQLIDFLEQFRGWSMQSGFPTGSDDPLFPSWSRPGSRLTTRALENAFLRVLHMAGLNGHSIHDLRHTYATHLWLSSRRDLRLVQDQLGHASAQTTLIYIGTLDAAIAEAVNTIYERS